MIPSDHIDPDRLPMKTDLTSIVVTIVSSGVGAGFVTFWMNFWRAEWDYRRAKIEELYAAVHRYTLEMQLVGAKIRTERESLGDMSRVFATEDYDRINLLIDLYFRELHPTFKELTLALDKFLVQNGKFRRDRKGFSDDLLRIGNLRRAVKEGGSGIVSPRKFASIN